MANSSAKKIIKANSHRLNFLKLLIAISNVTFGAIRFGLYKTAYPVWYMVSWALLLFLYGVSFWALWSAAQPSYASDGTIIHGGEDITQTGPLEYATDIIFVCVLTQFVLLFSYWGSFVVLVIPAYMAYFFLSYFMSSSEQPDPSDDDSQPINDFTNMSRKERRKAERQARKKN